MQALRVDVETGWSNPLVQRTRDLRRSFQSERQWPCAADHRR